jgi:hypothetical protein
MPANPKLGRELTVTNVSNVSFFVDGNGKNINGAATYTFDTTQYRRASFIYSGAEWFAAE